MSNKRWSNGSSGLVRGQSKRQKTKSSSHVHDHGAGEDQQQLDQNSPFLNLPAEIRNSIYEYAAANTTSTTVNLNGVLYSPPLSLVCHQIREEFEEIYKDEAPKRANTVIIQLTNFIHSTGPEDSKKTVFDIVENLPSAPRCMIETVPHDSNNWNCTHYVFQIWLTNTFDSYLEHLRAFRFPQLFGNDERPSVEEVEVLFRHHCKVEIFYEPRSFDVQYCKGLLSKLRWSFGSNHQSPAVRTEWWMIEDAFDDAFKRYELPKSSARKRRRI